MLGWLDRWFERRRKAREEELHRQMFERMLTEVCEALNENERFIAPMNFFRSQEEIQSFVVKICKRLGGINVRANAAFGALLFYRDDGSDGLGVRIIGEKDEAAT